MANDNCLQDMKCPDCGALEPFNICVEVCARMYDSGVNKYWEPGWDDDSDCCCPGCDFEGTVLDFKVKEEKADKGLPCDCPVCGTRANLSVPPGENWIPPEGWGIISDCRASDGTVYVHEIRQGEGFKSQG